MKRQTSQLLFFAAVALCLGAVLFHLSAASGPAAAPARLILEPSGAGAGVHAAGLPPAEETFKLKLESGSNGVIYVIQSSTNLKSWQTLFAVKSTNGVMALADFSATNDMQYFRLIQADDPDTNAPSWGTNGVQGRLTSGPPGKVLAKWAAATDNTGVAAYKIFINGTLYTNVFGSVLSTEFSVNPHARTEITIQALDAAGNASSILIMSLMPGDNLLAVSDDSGRVFVFQYQPGNTNLFSPRLQIADFGSNDRGLGMGDFDRDGFLDIVAGSYQAGNMRLFFFKGQGDGTFAAGRPLPALPETSGYVMDAAVGDFDSDGNLDFVANANSSRSFFFWGNGDGTFTGEVRDLGGNVGRGMTTGDFDEDGRLDLARAKNSDGQVRIFLSNGDRTFFATTNATWTVGNDPYGLAAGDFDEDGHLDLIANGSSSGDVTFLKGFGDGTFTNLGLNNVLYTNLDINTYGAIDAFDYTGDGHLDLVMSSANGQAFYWAGNGNGTFSTNRIQVVTGISASFGIAAPPAPPRVDVNIAPLNPVIPLNGSVTLSAVGSGVNAGDVFRWTFGDVGSNTYAWTFTTNQPNAGPTVTHAYTNISEGKYVARLWHTSGTGIQSTRGTVVTIQGNPPVAQPGGPYVLGELAATQAVWYATLDGTNSTDDFGIVSYIWSFGDGTAFVTNSSSKVLHGWASNGVWTVGLTVVDAAGLTGSNSTTVRFTNGAPPVAVILGPDLVDETVATNGNWFAAFRGTNSTDDVGIWKYEWNFGNNKTATGPVVSTTYGSVGTNTVRLTVTDNAGQTNSTTKTVVVKANALPVPVIGGERLLTEAVATKGLWFGAFNGTNSTDDKGIYQYAWKFGDGATGTGATVTHNYAGTGVYPLVLTVTDFGDQTASITQNVVVVAGELPVARITATPLTPEGAQPVALSAAPSTDDFGIAFYRWLLPTQRFEFNGSYLDPNQWSFAGVSQDGRLNLKGANSWGSSYFFSRTLLVLRGGTVEGRVDTPTTTPSRAVVGFRNLDPESGNYTVWEYGIHFTDGDINIYELGNNRGKVTNYNKGTAYDFRIESKAGSGARYYLRPSGTGQAFVKIYESSNYSDAVLGFGATVYDPIAFGFDDFVVEGGVVQFSDQSIPVYPAGVVTLQVVDNALQTNSASIGITTITGAPPVAIITGPTNGLAGIELPFDGYFSSDDHAIASYTWDFGDGTPKNFGPAVSHRYDTAGKYTNTLTVLDYAGQSSSASLVVTITGGNLLVAVPWRIVGGIEQPHEVYAGKTVTLKAVARRVPVPFTFVWDRGDGSALVTNAVSNVVASGIYNLETTNAYTGADGTPYYATIRVYLTNDTILSDTYPMLVRPKTLDTEMKVAIDEGLWYLHKVQNRYDIDANNRGGDWVSGGYKINATASAVHSFGINGHSVTDDTSQDPYVETVQRGINYLLTTLITQPIGPQTYGDPDGNHNGIGLYGNTGQPIYETGPILDALVAATRPELIAQVGGANVKGRAFLDLMQDLVDVYSWGQGDHATIGGGWHYGWNDPQPDNSTAQWGAIGLYAAEHYWGILIPQWIKDRNLVWVAYTKGGTGFGYTGAGDGIATTPSAMVQLAFDGVPTTNALWLHGDKFLANNWTAGVNVKAANNIYANYAIAKTMRTAVPQAVHNLTANGLDWFLDPANGMARFTVDRQAKDGSWTSSQWVDVQLASSWSVIILSSSLFQRGPVAVISMKPNPAAVGFPVVLDARASYHQHPAYKVAEYRWDFNPADGLDFEHPDAVGPVVTNSYSSLSTNTVTLQVRDNATPALSDVASIVVRVSIPPFQPTPDAGGPYYAAVGEDIHLDGSGSFDVDAAQGDFIQSYSWEIDFQQPIDFSDGVTGRLATVVGGFPTAGPRQIGLRVKDATSIVFPQLGKPDLTADDFTTVYVYDKVIGDLKTRPKGNKIQLTWTRAGDSVAVLRSTLGPDRGFQEIGRTFSAYATFLDTNVEYNVEYFYRLVVYANNRQDPIGISDSRLEVSRQRGLEDHRPVFQSTPLRLTRVGDLYNPTLDAVDPENDPITFNVLQGPTNLTVNATNGVVNFTPTIDQLGLHNLTFEATNAAGRDVLSFSIFVYPASNTVPVVTIGGPYAALTGQPIQFTATASDPDGNVLFLTWSFGDGTTATNANPVHTYGAAGDYLVTLFVNDGYGGTASAKTHAVITRPNRPPTATIAKGPHFNIRLGEALNLDGSGSFDLDGDPITFAWGWGDPVPGLTNGPTASHTYTAVGNYAGQLIVADNRGGSGTNGFDVTVAAANQPPSVVLNLSSNSPYANTEVTFDADSTVDPEGDPLTFEWDFGDRFKTSGRIVTHVYLQIGDFPLTVTVRDNHGGLTVVTQLVHAINAPPQFTSAPPLLVKSGKPYAYTPTVTDINGDTVTFQLRTNPPTMSVNTNTGALDWLPGTNDVGPHAIVLRATDSHGASADQSFSLVVTTPTGPEMDLEPVSIVMTNVVVDSQSLVMTGTVRVVFRNNGDDPVPVPYTVSVFVDADGDGAYSTNPVPGLPADRRVAFAPVQAGAAKGFLYTLEMSVQGQALYKDAPLSVFVDSENVLPEFNENNNLKRSGFDVNTNNPPVLDVSASRLLVDRSGLPASALLAARLGNSGYVPVPTNVSVAFYNGDPKAGGVLIGVARSTSRLLPGTYEDVSVTWTNPVIAKYTVYVVADDNGTGVGALVEITKANNTFSAEADLTANEPPVANAGPDGNILLGDYALLNGSGSSDPENKPLKYNWSMLSIPIGSRAQLTNATTVQPHFRADVAGEYQVRLVVNDGTQDSTNTDTVVITAVDTNANHYPVISSRPTFQGMSNVLYTYAVQATDEDGDKLTYSLAQFPAGMTINPTNGLIRWTPTNTGSFFVQANVFDSKGAGIFQSWTLTIVPFQNLPPQFTSTPVQTGTPGTNYTYDVDATDANNDTITFALVQRPANMNINATSGVITWTPTAAQIGANPVRVSANDGKGGVSTQAFNVVVFTPGQDGPVVQSIPGQTVVGPAVFATIPLDPYVFDPNDPKSALTWTVTGTNKLVVTINSNRVATITYTNGTLTSETLTFLATDPSGKAGFASALFTVRAADNPPVAVLANLSDTETTSIQTGTFDLKGTADDPDTIDDVAYRVVLYDGNGARVADVTPGPINAAGWHEGRVPAGGSLGTLDFTLVRNGGYTLALEVRGGNLIASTTATIALDTQLKLGQVTFEQQDLVLPISGVGLQIVRTYDSLNPAAGEFGYSWAYSVTDLGFSINEQRVQEQDLFGETFSLRTGGGRDVTLTMPDSGQRVTFRFSLNQGGFFRLRAAWTPPPGVNATLVPTVSPNQIVLFQLRYWEAAPLETGLEGFDFPAFILTLQDGTQYRLDRENLGTHFIASDSAIGSYVEAYGKAHLTRVTATSGERTELVQQGGVLKNIEQYNSAGEKLKSILFQRNAQNRFSAIYTPENLDTNGAPVGPAAMTYEYDAAGNLIRANKLKNGSNPTNLVYASTTYLYEHPRFPHLITEMKDASGVTVMRFEYDAVGRLIGTFDAFGHKRTLGYNLSSHTSTVFDPLGNATVFAYDDRGNVLATTDPLGATTQFTYDGANRIISITDPLGNKSSVTYGANGELASRTDPLGHTTSYSMVSNVFTITDPLGRTITETFNTAGKIAALKDAAGNTTGVKYDANGNPTAVINPLGQKIAEATFDSQGRFTGSSNMLGVVETAGYDNKGNNNRSTIAWRGVSGTNEPAQATWTRNFDDAGNQLTSTDPKGNIVSYEYDVSGRRTAFTDSDGKRSSYLYNSSGKVIELDFPDGTLVRNVFDENGRPILTTDRVQAGVAAAGTRFIYDAAGRPVRLERLANVVVNVVTQQNLLNTVFVGSGQVISSYQTNYDAAGRVIGTSDSTGRSSSFEYDAAGRRTAMTDAYTNRSEFEYDAVGNLTLVRDPLARETRYLYDSLNRRVRTIFPDGSSTATAYSPLSQKTNVVDQLGRARDFEYDDLGHVTAVTLSAVPDPLQGGVAVRPRYATHYDDFGHMDSLTDPLGRTTRFGYDTNELLVSRTMPGGQQDRRSYDSAERLHTSTDFNGVTTEFVYDASGRITEKLLYNLATHTATQRVQYGFDAKGRRSQVIESRGVTSFSYSDAGLPARIQSPEGVVNYAFDESNQLTSVGTDNTENHYAYDSAGRLSSITVVKRQGQVLAQPETTTYDYSSIGLRTAAHLPNGVTTTYAYDNLYRLAQIVHRDPASNFLSSFSYSYRADGSRSGTTEVMKDSTGILFTNQFQYAYDGLGRVTNETASATGNSGGYKTSYTYDLAGNRLERKVSAGGRVLRTAYAYDVNSRLLSESNFVSAARSGTDGGAGIPYQFKGPDGAVRVAYRPLPEAWTYYLNESLPYVVGLSFVLPLAFLPWRRWRAGVRTFDLSLRHSWLTRCVTSGLVAAMVIVPMDWRAVAGEADLFKTLNTDTWGLDGSVTLYEYDANGAVTKKAVTGSKPQTVTYEYDLQRHLLASSTTEIVGGQTNTTVVRYVYNDEGIRVSQSRQTFTGGVPNGPAENIVFVVDTLNPTGVEQVLEELPAVGAVPTRSYTIGYDVLAQTSSTNPVATQYLLADGHRSTRQLVSATGTILACYSYDAYGLMVGGQPTPTNPGLTSYLYSGESFDVQQQQYFLRARHYDPSNGRFTSEDPFAGDYLNPQTTHKYNYCSGDPVNRVDPTGLFEGLVGQMVSLSIYTSLAMIGIGFLFGDILKHLSPIIPDAALIGIAATLKGAAAVPGLVGVIGFGFADPTGDPGFAAGVTGGTIGGGLAALQNPAALAFLKNNSMLVGGYEVVFSMASAQIASYKYFGAQLGTPSNSVSVYAGLIWNMWNAKDYLGYFASFGWSEGNYGNGFFIDPTDGKPWGTSFTFLSRSDSPGFGAGGNLTFYFPGFEQNLGHQMLIIPAWVGLVAGVTGIVSKQGAGALIGGILGVGTGYLWYKIKEMPRTEPGYDAYLNNRQTAGRPKEWNTGDPEPKP